jgi:competence protein ComEA
MARGSQWAARMIPWNTTPLAPPSSRWASLLARVRASAWGAIAVRAVAVVIGLVVLGWIGRTAAAGPNTVMSVASSLERDASAPMPIPIPFVAPDAGAGFIPLTAPPPPAPALAPTGRATTTEPVYLNQASVEELRRLPGVGPKRAEAILVLRQRLGRFQRVEDLLRVKGVGRAAVKKWRPLVRLDSPAAPDAGASGERAR